MNLPSALTSPAERRAEVRSGGAAVENSRAFHEHWRMTPMAERLRVIRRFRHSLATNCDGLARRHAEERPIAEVIASEIVPLADACKFLEKNAKRILAPALHGWEGRALWLMGVTAEVLREPYGVVLIVAPCNYPLMLPGIHALQALCAGNCVVLKPGRGGGAAAADLRELLVSAGLPEGALQVLGESLEDASDAIATRPDKVIFTGSAAAGCQVLAQLAPMAIPAAVELSGCDAVYVRADADLNLAAQAIAFGLRLNKGQTCIGPRRAIVCRTVANEFEGRLAEHLANSPSARFSESESLKLKPLVEAALSNGAHLYCGNIQSSPLEGPIVVGGGRGVSPLDPPEVFGPFLMVTTVADDEEALCRINDNPYGLGCSIFSRDASAARTLATGIQAGVVLINDMIAPTADARLPFGGCKMSGYGVTRGAEGLLEMTRPKVVAQRRWGGHRHLDNPRPHDAELLSAFLRMVHSQGVAQKLSALGDLFRAGNSMRKPEAMQAPDGEAARDGTKRP